MTREEIKNTPEIVDFMLDKSVIADSRMKLHKRLEEICELAIKTLEQEVCKDCISRQAVLDMMQMRMGGKELYKAVYDLPPVMPQQKIWVVTYWDKGEEPTVTAFDNRKAAECCYKVFKGSHDGCCIDETMLYHSFTIVQ